MTPHHPNLSDAIESRLTVCFRYHSENSSEEEPTVRIVEPWIYGCKNGKESLYGYQLSGGEEGLRRFDMRRVKKVEFTGEKCEHHPTNNADVTKWDTVFAAWHPDGCQILETKQNPADLIAA